MSARRIWLDRIQLLLILAGIGIASYLTYVKLFDIKPYCAGVGDCEAVQTSPYAELLGVPVAIWGLLSYLGLLALYLVKRSDWRGFGRFARQLTFLATLVGVMYSAYLTYLELFVINAICPWCVASAIVMTALFVLSILDVFAADEDNEDLEIEAKPVSSPANPYQ
ncbi:MAG TPA: vitamin K epoxide reductase family protein [Anaerolineae bacterium]|nr:vitamin K epoxide reductase family protein [Anaerolineae bacterium]